MPLPEDWRAFIESLNSHGVEYVVVGAVALAHHGFPRYTGDLDVLVRNSTENTKRVESALAEFGFAALGLKAADFSDTYRVIQLGVPPHRIDILTSLTGVTFDAAWAGRVEAVVGETRVSFIGREALILNKRMTGRTKDKADLEALGASEEVDRVSIQTFQKAESRVGTSSHQSKKITQIPNEDIAELLINSASRCTAREAERRVPNSRGFYAIFLESADALSAPLARIMRDQPTENLLYIGIATKSLFTRLVEQDLHHKAPSAFFRSLGAVLLKMPIPSHLFGQENQNNFRFDERDTKEIIEWIDRHLSVRWLCRDRPLAKAEADAIKCYRPSLNIRHNPTASIELRELLAKCRAIARQAPPARHRR
jgi:hypothetical protein